MRSTATIRRLAAILLGLLLLSPAGHGEIVADIDAARIAVADRSDGALRAAQVAGLEEVVVKMTGAADALLSPALEEPLQAPQRFLRGYSYAEGEGGDLYLELSYDGDALRRLLRDAGLPLWTANRPPVIAWLVWNDGRQRRFASSDESPQLRAALQEVFRRRGLPLQQPLYDLPDAEALSPGAAWRQSSSALMAASARYAPASVLAGRVARLSDGNWLGDWRFLDDRRWVSRPVTAPSLEGYLAEGADLVATTLAARYAVSSGASEDLRYRVLVSGVADFSALLELRRFIAGVEVVERVVPERLDSRGLSLRVESAASVEQLARLLELDSRVQRQPTGQDADLAYRWIVP
jgi:hypothetical protein